MNKTAQWLGGVIGWVFYRTCCFCLALAIEQAELADKA